jgi:dihydropteroate synthase
MNSPLTRWSTLNHVIVDGGARPRVMGILNLTPDSFSDGGRTYRLEPAVRHAERLLADGADLLDLGGESSRPGAEPISLREELRRVLPVLDALRAFSDIPISIDTTKAEVARQALDAGADVINDVTALQGDPEMTRVIADRGAGVVLMHMAGTPATMQQNPSYANVVTDVYDMLAGRIDELETRGINRERIAIDPGIGFGKTFEHNLALLQHLSRFVNLGCVVLVGTSRKGFLGTITGRPLHQRDPASVVSSLWACTQGARIVRVHDVGGMADALRVWNALRRPEGQS